MIKICITGDSISSAHARQGVDTIGEYIARQVTNCKVRDICYPSENVSQQTNRWNQINSAEKLEFDYVFCMNGHNDNKAVTADIVTLYQSFYNLIKAQTKASCKLILLTLTPCRETAGTTEEQRATWEVSWLAFNNAKRGIGSIVFTNTDGYVDEHTNYLDNGAKSLKTEYHSSITDHLHMNAKGIEVVADACVQKLRNLNLV